MHAYRLVWRRQPYDYIVLSLQPQLTEMHEGHFVFTMFGRSYAPQAGQILPNGAGNMKNF